MYLEMKRLDEEEKARLNLPALESEAMSYLNGYLSGLADARAQVLLARTKEMKHEALDCVDNALIEFTNTYKKFLKPQGTTK